MGSIHSNQSPVAFRVLITFSAVIFNRLLLVIDIVSQNDFHTYIIHRSGSSCWIKQRNLYQPSNLVPLR